MNGNYRKSVKPVVGSDMDLEHSSYCLQKFTVYETRTKFFLIGRDNTRTRWRVLKIDRSDPAELNIHEDPAIYTKQHCHELLNRLAEGNRACGGVNFVTKAYGVVGFIKFLEPYYMILITKRKLIGKICGHAIYGIEDSSLLTIPHPSVVGDVAFSKAESRYKRLFSTINISRNFFYSYTYRIMWTLQRNETVSEMGTMPYDDMFVWNAFLTRDIRKQIRSLHWTVAMVHGFFQQVKLVYGNANFTLTLIARRSRHFAGTRYLKRGVNAKGRVANDVETEQLVHEEHLGKVSQISSVVQHRGSIPLFWSQETSVFSPKPDIILHKSDPTYDATKLHFENLSARYGDPVIVLNLVKTVEKRPRETILCQEFANAVAYLNHNLPKLHRVKFIQWDFHKFAERRSADILQVLEFIARDALELIGFYYNGRPRLSNLTEKSPISTGSSNDVREGNCKGDASNDQQAWKQMFQHGVLRTNCIDCLDRTNVAQYAFGLTALGQQMHALGLCNTDKISSESGLAVTLMEMYECMGDVLAIQYGGSAAHNKVFSQRQGKWNAAIHYLEFLRSIRRHYNNAYLDGEKQDAINIFLGHFRPEAGKLALWQLDSDHHLQIRRAGDVPLCDLRLSLKRSLSAGNILDQNDVPVMFLEESSPKNSHRLEVAQAGRNSNHGLVRGLTVSEVEMKQCLGNAEYEIFTDVKHEESDPFSLNHVYGSMHKPVDTQGLGDCADFDWLSSSGNSCQEDAQERDLMSVEESDNWPGSNLLCGTDEKGESFENDECFQDMTQASLKVNVKYNRQDKMGSFGDVESILQEEQVGSGIIRLRPNGAASLGVFSKSFVDWISEGQTLCY